MPPFVHPTAVIDADVTIGEGAQIWHFAHVCSGATIGAAAVLGHNVFVGTGVAVGARSRVQNNVSLFSGVVIEEDVFLGPSCVFTNVRNPRAEISRKGAFETTRVMRGATVGANATIRCGATLGRYAFVGAGAVVLNDVPDHALVVGNPARPLGFCCRCGERLCEVHGGGLCCGSCGARYRLDGDTRCQPE